MSRKHSEQLFRRAQKHIPGGVNSPVRAFKGVGGTPVFFRHAEGLSERNDTKCFVFYAAQTQLRCSNLAVDAM